MDVKRISEVQPYSGKNAIEGMRFRPFGRALGVSAWGMNVIEIDPGCEKYPEHDHAKDGQEEVYIVLRGSASVNGAQVSEGMAVRVPPNEKRKFIPGPQGVTLLALGATPGKAYEPRR